MRRLPLVVALLVIGGALMANPLYLPVALDDTTTGYSHAVQPIDQAAIADDAEVVDRADLDPDAREAFDRARDAPEGGFTVESPEDRVDSLPYPTEPTTGDGILVVADGDGHYEFWTRAVEREPATTVVQRLVVQPAGFLLGFFAIVAAVAVTIRGREEGGERATSPATDSDPGDDSNPSDGSAPDDPTPGEGPNPGDDRGRC